MQNNLKMSGNRLKELMRLLNLTQQDVANLLGIKQSAISQIASNKKRLLPKHIDILVDTYKINREWLEGYDNALMFVNSLEKEELMHLFEGLDKNEKNVLLKFARFLKQQNSIGKNKDE